MSKCHVCQDDVKELDKQNKHHLIITEDNEGHVHTHGEIENKEAMKDLLDAASQEIGIPLITYKNKYLPKEIVFHNRQRIGDMLMFTCGVRDFKLAYPHIRVNVIATAMHIWDHNPHIDRTLVGTESNIIKIGPTKLTNSSNRLDWHFANAFRLSMEDALKIQIPQGESRPDIYFTQEEYDEPRIEERPYWIICIGGEKGWGCKMYPFKYWQEFVSQNPDTLFYQIGSAEDNHPRLQGANVVDYIGKTQSKENGIRDLFKLFLNAEGSIGLVSFHMHLSGALNKPAIIVAGAREPVSFTRYAGHQYLATDGCLPCAVKACWHCAIDACTNLVIREDTAEKKIPKCVDMISPEDLSRALDYYYIGGRLDKDAPSAKPLPRSKRGPINIVPTPPKLPQIAPSTPTEELTEAFGMKFGGGSLTGRDWNFIESVILQYKVKTVLEFGAGLSTLLLNNDYRKVVTYETSQGWIDKINKINPGRCDIRLWDSTGDVIDYSGLGFFDMAFVDGPSGDKSRELSTFIASRQSNIVIVHDAGREWARKYQDMYLKDKFDGPIKGGHRCHLWLKKTADKKNMPVKPPIVEISSVETPKTGLKKSDGKFIKIVSTARGWGGCARSVTTIMRMLLAQGHKVEFIPFRNKVSSSEFKEILKGELKDVIVTEDYDTIHEKCDTLLVYADDYIWEFARPEIIAAFSAINADRKIMMLNYRRGKVGELEWTRQWDKYMFLNSTQEKELLKVHAGVATKVLPPCTDLKPFFEIKPDYNHSLRIVRHSSQGDTKFVKDNGIEIQDILATREDVTIKMLPGPSWAEIDERFSKVSRTANPEVISKFLSSGNLFWYSLPEGYMDMGPRVILEAMAAGLPVLADNWGGAIDRVTPECGWLVNKKEEFAQIIKSLTPKELEVKGNNAKQRAFQEFRPERWIQELIQ